jgi:hypothetical protein
MVTKLLSWRRQIESSGASMSIYHKNKSDDVILSLIKQLKNRKVLIIVIIMLVLLSVWYYFN